MSLAIAALYCERNARGPDRYRRRDQALNTTPRKRVKKGHGEASVGVTFAGLTFRPGEWI